jgi:prepilin-type N-terminal cleavage/methylation domain-containing protein
MALGRGDSTVRRARRGFTLLELLGVIGIMLILISLAVIGFEQLDRSANGKQTRAMLDDCTAMLDEFEATSGGIQGLGEGSTAATTTDPYPAGAGAALGGSTAGETTSMVSTSGTYGRYGTAVINTWYVMAYLMRDPKVKDMVQKLPPTRILTIAGSTGSPVPWYPWYSGGTAPTGMNTNSGAVLLDGWGNPIIFVPSGGIIVWKKGQISPTPITSRDNLPFFASAGPDGDFGADAYQGPLPAAVATGADNWPDPGMNVTRTPMGDDNIYSFENGQ